MGKQRDPRVKWGGTMLRVYFLDLKGSEEAGYCGGPSGGFAVCLESSPQFFRGSLFALDLGCFL